MCFVPLAGVSRSGTSFPERFGITNSFSHRIASSMATGREHIVSSSFHQNRCSLTTCPHGSRPPTHRAVCGCGMSCRNAGFCLVHTLICLLSRVPSILCFSCSRRQHSNAFSFQMQVQMQKPSKTGPPKLVIVHVLQPWVAQEVLGYHCKSAGFQSIYFIVE